MFFCLLLYVKMRLNKVLVILFLLFGMFISSDFYAQSGGRRKEHKNQRRSSRIFQSGVTSRGNADAFARGAGRTSLFKRLFKNDRAPAWVMHHRKEIKAQRKDNGALFTRYRTKGKRYRAGILAKQNSDRARTRKRGNKTFATKKYS